MPELPEAETARRYLEAAVLGAKIRRVEVPIPRSARSHESPEELAALVEGKKILRLGRRGKAVLLFLDGKQPATLIIRLGMSGHIRVAKKGEEREKHLAGVLELTHRREIRYVDPRTFGLMVARPGHDVDTMPEFEKYGPEPFSEAFAPEYLKQTFARRSVDIEVALMDQSVVAGIGKIYADEICFRAGIRPTAQGELAHKTEAPAAVRGDPRGVDRSHRMGRHLRGGRGLALRSVPGSAQRLPARGRALPRVREHYQAHRDARRPGDALVSAVPKMMGRERCHDGIAARE